MSRWADNFIATYKETGTVSRLTKEIKDAINKDKRQKQVDQDISDVLKGKYKKKG